MSSLPVTLNPTASGRVAPSPTVRQSLAGSGSESLPPFTASGDSVTVAYSFRCPAPAAAGKFAFTLYDRVGNVLILMNASETGLGSSSDSTQQYLDNTFPPYHIAVHSECRWTITVTA